MSAPIVVNLPLATAKVAVPIVEQNPVSTTAINKPQLQSQPLQQLAQQNISEKPEKPVSIVVNVPSAIAKVAVPVVEQIPVSTKAANKPQQQSQLAELAQQPIVEKPERSIPKQSSESTSIASILPPIEPIVDSTMSVKPQQKVVEAKPPLPTTAASATTTRKPFTITLSSSQVLPQQVQLPPQPPQPSQPPTWSRRQLADEIRRPAPTSQLPTQTRADPVIIEMQRGEIERYLGQIQQQQQKLQSEQEETESSNEAEEREEEPVEDEDVHINEILGSLTPEERLLLEIVNNQIRRSPPPQPQPQSQRIVTHLQPRPSSTSSSSAANSRKSSSVEEDSSPPLQQTMPTKQLTHRAQQNKANVYNNYNSNHQNPAAVAPEALPKFTSLAASEKAAPSNSRVMNN